MKARSLRWRLTWVSVKCVLVAWLVWLGCQAWQLSRAHYGFWDESQREVAAQILESMPDGLQSLPPRERPDVPAGHRDHKMSWQVWAGGRNVVYSVAAPDEPLKPDFRDGFARRKIAGQVWHVYSLSDPKRGLIVQVGRSKEMIANEIARWVGLSLLAAGLIFVLFVLTVWIVIGRSLRPVAALRDALRARPPLDLTPLQAPGLPTEFSPLVDAFNDQLTRVDQAVQNERRFIADAAHELRTPLAVLSAHADLARRAATEEERDTALRRLSAGVARAARLSEQLLDLARLDAQTVAPTLLPLDIAPLLVLVVRDFETLARERHQRIGLRTEDGRILGDVDLLGILIRNLVDNAVRYAGEGGRIEVICRRDVRDGVGGIALCVADDGPGVVKDERERIFHRFYRANGGTHGDGSPRSSGSGIGLSLVARIARTHHARIHVEDGLDGRGLAITVFFPAA
ncbi:sensor histidine kinase [Lysobacter auxotrophicus]|uniref:histidine kinase n=1 Tax=Lysobacter auxotrophicus TaxID=2992573 RepID=A0ABM8D8G3_9GAMM|nr:ATP-binding protein [Lysobacter auxotrophicus]BDU14825.1 ATP-binding protein [Lysobacter auxotrophicus]